MDVGLQIVYRFGWYLSEFYAISVTLMTHCGAILSNVGFNAGRGAP
jgi:hypothetical protein